MKTAKQTKDFYRRFFPPVPRFPFVPYFRFAFENGRDGPLSGQSVTRRRNPAPRPAGRTAG
jgi:hypothetical protein